MTIVSIALPVTGLAAELNIKAITAKATADNPQYKNKEAWPDLVGDEYFLKQEWPKARLLIWAHAGKVQKRSDPKIDPKDPVNWIDAATGKAADASPDMDTDLILPDSDVQYRVTPGRLFACRHLTVGSNANYRASVKIFGNVWIRPGGKFYAYRSLMLLGTRDTFFRKDWPEDGVLKKLHDTGARTPFVRAKPKASPWGAGEKMAVSHFFNHNKEDASTEILGYVRNRDEFANKSGTIIVGRGSRLMCGTPAWFKVLEAGTIVLMDGAVIGKSANEFVYGVDIQGTITGGTPDRPLKRDARIGVPYHNWMHLTFEPEIKNHKPQTGGISGSFSGKITCYPALNSDARVVIGWSGIGAWRGYRGRGMTESFFDTYAKLQPKITLWIGEKAELENVRFEDLHRGGIILPDANASKSWKNVTFGDGCLSKDPNDIFREFKKKGHQGPPNLREQSNWPVVKEYISM
jgi:hypothetical protein